MWPWSRKSFSMSPSLSAMAPRLFHAAREVAGEVGPRLVDSGGAHEAALAQLPGGFQDRVGGRAEEGIDAPHVADDVEVQRAGLDRLQRLPGEALEAGVVVGALEVAEAPLFRAEVRR